MTHSKDIRVSQASVADLDQIVPLFGSYLDFFLAMAAVTP